MKLETNSYTRKESLSRLKEEAKKLNKPAASFCPNRHNILLNQLSKTEIKIVGYLKQGYENDIIAKELGISTDKLGKSIEHICKQLGTDLIP